MSMHWCKSHAREDLCWSGEPELVEPNDVNVVFCARNKTGVRWGNTPGIPEGKSAAITLFRWEILL